ncbi:acetyltransferase [Desulfoferula mesophila]|uniref:Acetyltransferase n=1 Tax=Desulfoferula mesophila TaxID=3058419 RepID=A0AAU9EPC6_9BACT|nr:acetyltransferase [Desulfoferula mesophilus]
MPLSKPAIQPVAPSRYPELLAVWEASVRATHNFLSEADIAALKPLILERYFAAVDLRCAVAEDGRVLGFVGMAKGKIEMLFIAPEHRGRGIGTLLARHAIERHGVTKVDVNEQNPQALGFYHSLGFRTVGRSATDGQGRPFPLLHLELGQA